jgi:class 3 adenylate cyclase/tetratricopeptide (TPR) repeat protein
VQTCANCGQENPEGFQFCGRCGNPIAVEGAAPREVRKTVTIVFSDVTGSTALGERLDPETTRRVMGRYFDAMRAAIERHGGTVEKFIGDAVMAVFGIPTLHEDDAHRAVRAAVDMRAALAALNDELERDFGVRVEARTGVNTGEVVAGEGQTLATGDAVNVAARLQQAAQPGEILIGAATHRLVRDAVTTEPVPPVEAKGKSEPLWALRLIDVVVGAEPFARRLDAPMVGRESELSQLRQAYERADRGRTANLFTILGSAGMGKSRLVREFLDDVEGEATVLVGRCLPYGEGITYWPLVEILRQATREEIRGSLVELLQGDEQAELVAERLTAVVGETQGASEEIAWAARKLFEWLARERPLVVVLDDLHWAEPTFLDLVEHVADWSRGAPMLLVAVARPELLDTRPTWAGGKMNATSILLEPLSDNESERLIDALLADPRFTMDVRRRVVQAAEGNPLFVEQMLAMASEDGLNGDLAVPPTIQALLAARLERLPLDERATVERASVVGKEFSLAEVRELSPPGERAAAADHVLALVRKELVRPAHAAGGDDVFRFRHLLIRDAAYEAMSKEARAELHERYADHLETLSREHLSEFEEIAGYHLEQAYRYRIELGPLDEAGRALGERAAERLAEVGRRALGRGDLPAAETLLERAIALLSPEDGRAAELACDLSVALRDQGRLDQASATLSGVLGSSVTDRAARARAELLLTYVNSLTGGSLATALESSERLVGILAAQDAERHLAEAYHLLGIFRTWQGNIAAGQEAHERAAGLAKRSGNMRIAGESTWWLVVDAVWGPTPVEEALRLCRRILNDDPSRLTTGAVTYLSGAFSLMLDSSSKEARERIAEGAAVLEELGQLLYRESGRMAAATALLFAGELSDAEDELRRAHAALTSMGEAGFLSTVSSMLALVLCGQGRYDEADAVASESEALGAPDDLTTQSELRGARAQILAARGEAEAAIAVGRSALALVEPTDLVIDQAFVHVSLGAAFRSLDRPDEARAAFEQAVQLLAKKGIVPGVAYTRRLIAEL